MNEDRELTEFRILAISKFEKCECEEDVRKTHKVMISGFGFMEALGFDSSYRESRRPIVEELTNTYLEKFKNKGG